MSQKSFNLEFVGKSISGSPAEFFFTILKLILTPIFEFEISKKNSLGRKPFDHFEKSNSKKNIFDQFCQQ